MMAHLDASGVKHVIGVYMSLYITHHFITCAGGDQDYMYVMRVKGGYVGSFVDTDFLTSFHASYLIMNSRDG